MLGSRAARGAVGRMERSIGGARYTSSSLLCQVVETKERNLASHPKPTHLETGDCQRHRPHRTVPTAAL